MTRPRDHPGDVLFRPGEACRGFFVVRSGVVPVGLNTCPVRKAN